MRYESVEQFIKELKSKGFIHSDNFNSVCPKEHEPGIGSMRINRETVYSCDCCKWYYTIKF